MEKPDEKEAEGEVSNGATADAVEEDKKREKAMPSNVLEKGIIYFFTRGRVGVEDPDSVQDLARSYFVLRPLPDGAKLTDGSIQDVGNNRLVALPKKVWPKSGKDRFMVFVDKAKASMATLKEEFFQGSDYSTQTMGTRHTPEVTPLGEGVYAITSTGGGQGTTHLAYMLTIPSEVGEVQKDVGLKEKGSFVLSIKNPEASAPPNAQLPATAEYPKEIIEEFRGRSWMPAHPKHIDYNNASLLLIGEDFDSSSNLDPAPKDEKHDEKVTPQEELEKLENEDELRVEHLKGKLYHLPSKAESLALTLCRRRHHLRRSGHLQQGVSKGYDDLVDAAFNAGIDSVRQRPCLLLPLCLRLKYLREQRDIQFSKYA